MVPRYTGSIRGACLTRCDSYRRVVAATELGVECHTRAFTDFTAATRVLHGSNRWGDKLRPTFDETVPAEMGRGSVPHDIAAV